MCLVMVNTKAVWDVNLFAFASACWRREGWLVREEAGIRIARIGSVIVKCQAKYLDRSNVK